MPVIKIHLEDEEFAPVRRLAEQLHLTLEDVAYSALNRLMMMAKEQEVRSDIASTRDWRMENLPQWSDAARSVHAYECKTDHHSAHGR